MAARSHHRMLTAALAVAALALGSLAATSADEYAVAVDDLQATAAAPGTIDVSGAISWSGGVEINQDGSGDATVPQAGTDMTSLVATRDMGSGVMAFTMHIADGIPTHGGPNEVINWGVPLTVGSGVEVELQAWRSAQYQRLRSTDPYFSVNVCEPNPTTGGNTCTPTEVSGEFTDQIIRWDVPLSLLGSAQAGDHITSGQAWADVGAAGLVWYAGGPFASDLMGSWDALVVPGEVELELIRDADGQVTTRTVDASDGAFSRSVDGLSPGDYWVTATTCFNTFTPCASKTLQVTVS